MLHHIERSNIRPLRGRKAAYSHGRQPSIAIHERVEAWCVVCDGEVVSLRRGLLTIAVGDETSSSDEPTKSQCHRGASPKGGGEYRLLRGGEAPQYSPSSGKYKKTPPCPDGERAEEERDEKENAEVSRGSSEGGWSFQTGIGHSRG